MFGIKFIILIMYSNYLNPLKFLINFKKVFFQRKKFEGDFKYTLKLNIRI